MESIQTNKIHKEEKRKILSDNKSKLKREKSKDTPKEKVQLGVKNKPKGILIGKKKNTV